MRPIRDVFYIRADKDSNKKLDIKGVDGNHLFLDTDFNKYHHAVQMGEIVHCPMKVTPRKKQYNDANGSWEESGFHGGIELNIGDKIYFHHFVVDPRSADKTSAGEELFQCHYRDIYCVIRDEKIIVLEDWVLVEPIMEDESNYQKKIGNIILLTKTNPEFIKQQGVVKHLSVYSQKQGIKKEDKVYFHHDADYSMKIEGKSYYRMKVSNVFFKYINN